MDKKIRVGIAGTGPMAEKHIAAIMAHTLCEPVAVVSSSIERARGLADKYQFTPYDDLQELLVDEDIALLDICNRNDMHYAFARTAMESGVNVIIEKPVCFNKDELRELVDLAAARKLRAHCVFQKRYGEVIGHVKGYMQRLKPTAARSYIVYSRDSSYYERKEKALTEFAGGGVLINQAIHELDCLLQVHGKVREVSGAISNRYHKIQVEDTADLTIEFESGITIPFFATTAPFTDSRTSYNAIGFDSGVLVYNNSGLEFFDTLDIDEAVSSFLKNAAVQSSKSLFGKVRRKLGKSSKRGLIRCKDGKYADLLNEVTGLVSGHQGVEVLTALESCAPAHELIFDIYGCG